MGLWSAPPRADEPFIILQITRRAKIKEGNESQGNTSPYRKLYQQFGAVCGNDYSFLIKKIRNGDYRAKSWQKVANDFFLQDLH
jgi:hypothetical protein